MLVTVYIDYMYYIDHRISLTALGISYIYIGHFQQWPSVEDCTVIGLINRGNRAAEHWINHVLVRYP